MELKDSVVLCILSALLVAVNSECPTWCVDSRENVTEGLDIQCECGASVDGAINCNKYTKQVEIRIGWCMTDLNSSSDASDQKSNVTSTLVVGECPYLLVYNKTNRALSSLPSDPAQLTHTMCDRYHRTGLLCGQCVKGYGPALYSTDLHCSNCSDMSVAAAVILHMLLEILPSVLLFIIFMLFDISIMHVSGPMFGYFTFCQAITFVIRGEPSTYNSVLLFLPSPLVTLSRISMTISSVWGLLFFRFIVPPFCISSRLTGIHVSMLGYVTALFPLGLIIIVYVGYETNVQNMRGIRCMCNLLKKLYSKMNKNMSNTHNSVIRAFATFIIMSITLVTFQTHSIVSSRSIYNVNGQVIRRVLYADPTIESYSPSHYPYLFSAVFLMFVLVLCPALVLIVYPTPLYEVLTRHISPRKQIAIKIFAETFQECFKDSLSGTKDYRILPGLSILTGVIYVITIGVANHSSPGSYFIVGFLYIVLSLAVSLARPCKTAIANSSLCFHFTLFGVWCILLEFWIHNQYIGTETLALSLVLLPLLPHLCLIVWLLYKLAVYILSRYYSLHSDGPWDVVKYVYQLVTMRHCMCRHSHNEGINRPQYDLLEP